MVFPLWLLLPELLDEDLLDEELLDLLDELFEEDLLEDELFEEDLLDDEDDEDDELLEALGVALGDGLVVVSVGASSLAAALSAATAVDSNSCSSLMPLWAA
ncbi:MAG: hypothetical protein QM650_06590 [Microlunatus sp.]